MLAPTDYEITEAENGQEALARAVRVIRFALHLPHQHWQLRHFSRDPPRHDW